MKIFLSFFLGGGSPRGKFFFQFFTVSCHSELLLNFSDFLQNQSDRRRGAGGGTKNPCLQLYLCPLIEPIAPQFCIH